MKIHENAALLDAFVDGELTAAEMAEVQAHLAECPGCQAYVDDALAIRADFPTADSTELPADFTDHIMQAVAKTPQSRPKKQPWGKLAAAAACLAVIVLVQYGAGLSSRNTSNEAAAYTADCAAAESTAFTAGSSSRVMYPPWLSMAIARLLALNSTGKVIRENTTDSAKQKMPR